MLHADCHGCPNETRCEFLATAQCARCPQALICPAEQLVRGFHDCSTPLSIFSKLNQAGVCQLKEKFARVPRPVTHQSNATTPPTTVAQTQNDEPRCLRCGSIARQTKSHSARMDASSEFGIFQDMKLDPQYIHICTKCGNQDRAKALLTKTQPIEEVAVFVLKSPDAKA